MKRKEPTPLEFALLGLLHQTPMSGYDLRKVLITTALGNYSSSPGAIYPALGRLEKLRLIKGREDRKKSLRPRKLFQPTAEGRRVFSDWLTRDVTREDVIRGLDSLMLRFAFHWVLASPQASSRLLEGLVREIEAYLKELAGQKKIFPQEAPVHPRLALEAGIEQYRATARWARKALAHFQSEAIGNTREDES